jgi:hypothetical protein
MWVQIGTLALGLLGLLASANLLTAGLTRKPSPDPGRGRPPGRSSRLGRQDPAGRAGRRIRARVRRGRARRFGLVGWAPKVRLTAWQAVRSRSRSRLGTAARLPGRRGPLAALRGARLVATRHRRPGGFRAGVLVQFATLGTSVRQAAVGRAGGGHRVPSGLPEFAGAPRGRPHGARYPGFGGAQSALRPNAARRAV